MKAVLLTVLLLSGAAAGDVIEACAERTQVRHKTALMTMLMTEKSGYSIATAKLLTSWKELATVPFQPILLLIQEKYPDSHFLDQLMQYGWDKCTVDRIPPPADAEAIVPKYFNDQFTKFQLWRLHPLERIIYVDADTLAVRNPDSLLTLTLRPSYRLAAARDYLQTKGGWLDTFNMGVFVMHPNATEYARLMQYHGGQLKIGHYDKSFSEQGFLNKLYAGSWKDIGFEYNGNLALYVHDKTFWNRHLHKLRIIHYTMRKPWAGCHKTVYKAICEIWNNRTLPFAWTPKQKEKKGKVERSPRSGWKEGKAARVKKKLE